MSVPPSAALGLQGYKVEGAKSEHSPGSFDFRLTGSAGLLLSRHSSATHGSSEDQEEVVSTCAVSACCLPGWKPDTSSATCCQWVWVVGC